MKSKGKLEKIVSGGALKKKKKQKEIEMRDN